MKNLIHTAVVTLFAASSAHAQQAVQWKVSDGGNGHWYQWLQRVPGRDWSGWRAYAEGIGGHLATVTTSAENWFVTGPLVFQGSQASINGGSAFIGAFQPSGSGEPDGDWQWVTGEPFVLDPSQWRSLEDCCGGSYCNNDGEDAAALWSWAGDLEDPLAERKWNDVGKCLDWWGAVIEWSADCNSDGIADYGQCYDGTLPDYNGNNVPDCCESGSSCAPNIIVNGGFEFGASQADCTWVVHSAAGSFVPGWSVVAASIDRVRITGSCPPATESWTSFEGEFTIDLDGDTSGGAISQTVSTEPGSMYRLTFQLTGNCAPGVKPMRVEIGSVQYPFEHVCAGTNPQPWGEMSVEFTASASTTSIGFRSLSTGGRNGAVIDAVQLVRVGPQQPTCVDADIYRDFNVNGADLGILLSQWGPNTPLTESDLNKDGVVNGADLGIMLAFWGACP